MRAQELTGNDGPPSEPESTGSFQTEGRGIVDSSGLGLYVVRRSDSELYERLSKREPCYVLAPRQIGKSSLRVRTQQRLRGSGVRCVSIDLTSVGSGASADEWYFSIAAAVAEQLDLEDELDAFWGKHRRMSAVRRFRQFLHDVILEVDDPDADPVVVFLDEIDVTLSLPFPRDDFFGLIRSTHEARADTPRWRRLTFCLIGVAAPLDLVADPERTPFNNSFAVRMDDFTPAEARTFLPALARAGGDAEALLDAVVAWTSGHPALTQRLCYRLTRQDEKERDAPAKERVEALVRSLFLSSGRIDDPILLDAERRFAGDRPDARIPVMLHLYRRLLDSEPVAVDGNNPRQFGLRIAGLAAEREEEGGTFLRVRSRIFASVFNHAWVEEKLARRFLTEPLQIWKDSGRKDDHVLRGKALDIALTWAQGREDVTPDEHEFLHASLTVANREQRERQLAEIDRAQRERAEHEVRAQRGLVRMAVLIVALCIASVALAVFQYMDAQKINESLQRQLEEKERTSTAVTNANEILIEKLKTEVRTAEEERQRAVSMAQQAQIDADTAMKKAEDASRRSSEHSGFKERMLMEEAKKKTEEAQRLKIAALNATEKLTVAESRADSAQKALAEAIAKSTTGSVADALEAEKIQNAWLTNRLNEQSAELQTANDEIKRLNRIIKERNDKVEKLAKERDAARNEVPRFATPPPNQAAPPNQAPPPKGPGDTYD